MPSPIPASERRLDAQRRAYASWANTSDRAARTAPARERLLARFEDQVDPDGVLSPQERATRAEYARKAYFASLALKSARARRKARENAADAEAAEQELHELGGGAA